MPKSPCINQLHAIIRHYIQQMYHLSNDITCPWDGSEGICLSKMLKGNPSWTLLNWAHMINHYFLSEGVNGARPRQWLPTISKYAKGPLDRYGRIKSVTPPTENRADRELRIAKEYIRGHAGGANL